MGTCAATLPFCTARPSALADILTEGCLHLRIDPTQTTELRYGGRADCFDNLQQPRSGTQPLVTTVSAMICALTLLIAFLAMPRVILFAALLFFAGFNCLLVVPALLTSRYPTTPPSHSS